MGKVLAASLLTSMLLVIVASTRSIFGLLNSTLMLTCVGPVATVAVEAYWDEACTITVTAVNWGDIEPGSSRNEMLFLKNEGSVPLVLSLDTADWSPSSTEDYVSLDWDYSRAEIAAGEIIRVTFSVTVSPGASESSTFDIVITGRAKNLEAVSRFVSSLSFSYS